MVRQVASVITGLAALAVGAWIAPGAALVAVGVVLLYLGAFVIDDEADS